MRRAHEGTTANNELTLRAKSLQIGLRSIRSVLVLEKTQCHHSLTRTLKEWLSVASVMTETNTQTPNQRLEVHSPGRKNSCSRSCRSSHVPRVWLPWSFSAHFILQCSKPRTRFSRCPRFQLWWQRRKWRGGTSSSSSGRPSFI